MGSGSSPDLGTGAGAQVRTLRDQCHADVAVMVLGRGDDAGKACIMEHLSAAFAPYAYAVVVASSASGNYTFAHEIGHIMGAGHDDRNDGNWLGMCSDSRGWHFRDRRNKSRMWRTIMAYPPGTRALNFSDPAIRFIGGPTGTATDNNARTLRMSAGTVATFR